jgi:DNA-directed RNA polymerase specialized sigma24 family protein
MNLRRKRADDLLARDYEALRATVSAGARAQLARKNVYFDSADIEAFYNQAWHGLHTELAAGRTITNHAGWLVTVTTRRALDEYRKLHRDRHADGAEAADQGTDADFAAQLDDAAKLRAFIEGMRDRLSVRECQAATLCYLQGLTRPDAAQVLGVEPKRLEKIMDGVSRKVGEFVRAIEEGLWCEARGSLMRAFAFGILDPGGRRYERAREHLDACTGCRAYVRSLRGLGALVPPVALPRGDAPEAGLLDHLADWLRDAKQAIHGLLGGPAPEMAGGSGLAVAGGVGVGGKLVAGSVGGKLVAGSVAAAIAVGGISTQAARSDGGPVSQRPAAAGAVQPVDPASLARREAVRRGEVVRRATEARSGTGRERARASDRSRELGAKERAKRGAVRSVARRAGEGAARGGGGVEPGGTIEAGGNVEPSGSGTVDAPTSGAVPSGAAPSGPQSATPSGPTATGEFSFED